MPDERADEHANEHADEHDGITMTSPDLARNPGSLKD